MLATYWRDNTLKPVSNYLRSSHNSWYPFSNKHIIICPCNSSSFTMMRLNQKVGMQVKSESVANVNPRPSAKQNYFPDCKKRKIINTSKCTPINDGYVLANTPKQRVAIQIRDSTQESIFYV